MQSSLVSLSVPSVCLPWWWPCVCRCMGAVGRVRDGGDWLLGCVTLPLCVPTVGGVHWFLLLAEQKPVSSLRPSPALSGLAAAAMAAEAAQHCVCVCNRFCCRRSANCVGQHKGGSICRRDCATVFFCSLIYFLADLWLLSCVLDEVAGLLSVRCLCVCV